MLHDYLPRAKALGKNTSSERSEAPFLYLSAAFAHFDPEGAIEVSVFNRGGMCTIRGCKICEGHEDSTSFEDGLLKVSISNT